VEEYGRTLILEQEIGFQQLHQQLRTGFLLHQVPTEQNWRQWHFKVEYGRMQILEQEIGRKHPHQHLRIGLVSHQVQTEQN
jgi:hypothetical protein